MLFGENLAQNSLSTVGDFYTGLFKIRKYRNKINRIYPPTA